MRTITQYVCGLSWNTELTPASYSVGKSLASVPRDAWQSEAARLSGSPLSAMAPADSNGGTLADAIPHVFLGAPASSAMAGSLIGSCHS